MYKLPEEKPKESGKYYARVVICPFLMPDTYEYGKVSYEDQMARYFKETDEWEILIDEEELVTVKGNICTVVADRTNIGDNYIITHWEYASKAKSTEFPPLEMPYKASDGNLFNREDLRDLYDEARILTDKINATYSEEESGFKVENEEDFSRLVKWNNINTPNYNHETEKFEYKEWFTQKYQGPGYYKIDFLRHGFINIDDNYKKEKEKQKYVDQFREKLSGYNDVDLIEDAIAEALSTQLTIYNDKESEIKEYWENIAKIYAAEKKSFIENVKEKLEEAEISEYDLSFIFH